MNEQSSDGEIFQSDFEKEEQHGSYCFFSSTPPWTGISTRHEPCEAFDPELFLSKADSPRWEESQNEGSFSGIPYFEHHLSNEPLFNIDLVQAEQPYFEEVKVGEEGIEGTYS